MFNPFRLKQPIGEEFNMDLDDSLNTKKALADLGHMKVPDHGLTEFPDRPMIDGVKSFQKEQGLAVDGVIKPDGPTIGRLNKILAKKSTDFQFEPSLTISGQVGENRQNHPRDVFTVQSTLGAVGRGRFPASLETSTKELSREIANFQKASGLKVDGWAGPGGETMQALSKALAQKTDEAEKKHLQLVASERRKLSEKEKDLCDNRLRRELQECANLPGKWHGPCGSRAYERWALCYRYGYTPGPGREPRKWGPADMENWFNPHR